MWKIYGNTNFSKSRRPGRRWAPPLPGKCVPLPLPASPLRLSIPVTRRTTLLVAASSRPPSSGGVQSRAAESIGDLGRSSGGSEYPSAGWRPFPLLVLSGLLSVLLLHFFSSSSSIAFHFVWSGGCDLVVVVLSCDKSFGLLQLRRTCRSFPLSFLLLCVYPFLSIGDEKRFPSFVNSCFAHCGSAS